MESEVYDLRRGGGWFENSMATGEVETDEPALSCGASPDEVHDFQAVTVFEVNTGPLLAGNNRSIQLDRHPVGFHAQLDKQCLER